MVFETVKISMPLFLFNKGHIHKMPLLQNIKLNLKLKVNLKIFYIWKFMRLNKKNFPKFITENGLVEILTILRYLNYFWYEIQSVDPIIHTHKTWPL